MTDPVKQSGRQVPDAKHTANTAQPSAASPDLNQLEPGKLYTVFIHGVKHAMEVIETDRGIVKHAYPIE